MIESKVGQELNRFSPEQRRLIYENLYAIELTDGCSVGCDFCGLDAKIGVREVIPFQVLEQIAGEISPETMKQRSFLMDSRIFLYDATEPLDYEHNGKNYFDVVNLFTSRGIRIGTSSAIPAGKEELAIANLDKIGQISISHMNRERLMPYFDGLGVVLFVDLFDYYFAKFGKHDYDNAPVRDFVPRVEGSIEETMKRLRKLDPTLPTKTRFYDLRKDGNRMNRNVQSLDVVCLFCGNDGKYCREGKVKDRDESQVRNNGRALHMGVFEREYPSDPIAPFGSSEGVKITTSGIFNVLCAHPSDECPSGQFREIITPEKFRVMPRGYARHETALYNIPQWKCLTLKT